MHVNNYKKGGGSIGAYVGIEVGRQVRWLVRRYVGRRTRKLAGK